MSAGKGDTYRPVNKKKYDKSYIKIFGLRCCNKKMTPKQNKSVYTLTLVCSICGKKYYYD